MQKYFYLIIALYIMAVSCKKSRQAASAIPFCQSDSISYYVNGNFNAMRSMFRCNYVHASLHQYYYSLLGFYNAPSSWTEYTNLEIFLPPTGESIEPGTYQITGGHVIIDSLNDTLTLQYGSLIYNKDHTGTFNLTCTDSTKVINGFFCH